MPSVRPFHANVVVRVVRVSELCKAFQFAPEAFYANVAVTVCRSLTARCFSLLMKLLMKVEQYHSKQYTNVIVRVYGVCNRVFASNAFHADIAVAGTVSLVFPIFM